MDSEELIIDPEIQSIIPPLTEDEKQQLEDNIVADNIVRDAIIRWKGRRIVLDGHNRLEIADRHGIDYRITDLDFPDRNAAINWVIRNQFGRRNLTPMQRAELALKLKPVMAAEAKKRMESGKPNPKQNSAEGHPRKNSAQGQTRDELANSAHVSHDTITKTETILEDADPLIADMARKGEISVNAAAQASQLPKRRQRSAAKRGPKAVKAAIKEAADKPAAPVDEVGNELPDSLHAAFASRERFQKVLNLLTQITKEINPLLGDARDLKADPGGEHLTGSRQEIINHLKDVRYKLTFAKPYAVCPRCNGVGSNCRECKGPGWLTATGYQNVPREIRTKRGAA
jgi:hypothetical protein